MEREPEESARVRRIGREIFIDPVIGTVVGLEQSLVQIATLSTEAQRSPAIRYFSDGVRMGQRDPDRRRPSGGSET